MATTLNDPYEVATTASADDIQKAYRKHAKKLQPDLNPGNPKAEEKFKEVAAAYDLVGDVERRKRFDRREFDAAGVERPRQNYYRDYASSEQDHPYTDNSGFADFMESEEAFAELLRRRARAQANRRGHDLQFRLPIEFVESIAGANKRPTLPDSSTIDVAILPGMTEGQVLRLRGKGAPGSGKGGPGDILIEVEIKPDRSFTRQGDDIYLELPVTLTEAVLGARIKVPTPTGAVTMTVPKGSNTGSTLRLRGKGRIASPRMLLDNFSPMTGSASPNRFGVVDGGKDQYGRAARGGVGGDGALPVGQTGREGADPRRAVCDDGLASQACGARTPATRDGWA